MTTAPHLLALEAKGVIAIHNGGVYLTRAAWREATVDTPYADPLLHFVGFKDDRVWSAIKVWGKPDFWHRFYDRRAVGDIAPGDKVVFADEPGEVREYSFDDSANW